ncbi:formate dehydrogenase subunit alpha [Thermodesulforhabdus norvegica]|uniref:nitrate reductase (cytochrome) n=1 Tax=Thermodesulforhabdus norvegica TaxID=39841 RepID=A0A1I4QVK4_9BACT|nr:formate dehydrogenase subunit alpha [Thermodesulforhabdus norvegica]SFM44104.1 formate dehydrogenase alpha subunit [Thermodesulforhabdus norvegica]
MRFDSVLTTCPFCGTGCNLFLEVMDNEVLGVSPVKWHPISRGKLCILGRNAHKFIQHPDRLTAPLKRVGNRFERISWEQALDEIAEKITRLRSESGPDALGFFSSAKCTNEENYLMMKLARGVIGTNNVDHCARLCHSSTVTGLAASFGAGAMTNSIPEIPETSCMLVTGSNPTSQHPIIAGWMLEAKERGACLIVIDPRKIPLSQHADLFLQLRPGTNIALFNGMARVILDKGLVNDDFVEARTEGIDELKAKLKDYDLDAVSRITGVERELIEKAAVMYASSPSAMIFYAMGITQHVTGTDNVKAVANLALLTGNVGRPSTGVNPLRGQNNVQGACDMGALPNVLTGYRPVTDSQARLEYARLWGCGDLPDRPGLTIVEMSSAALRGELRGLVIMGENPAVTDPDLNHVKEALSRLDLLVVIDIFMTETAQLADYVLPAATFAEKEGTFTNTDRRVQRVRKAVDPPGEAKADWEILCSLAKALGSKSFEYNSPEEIMNEIRQLTPSYRGITYERLDGGESLQWPCPDENHPGTPYLHAESFPRGKGRFYGVDYVASPEEPDDDYPMILTTGRVPYHWHGGSITRRIDTLNAEIPTGFVDINPDDAAKLGLKDGDVVKVSSRRGSISIKVKVSSEVKPGVIFIPMHFSECAANVLTDHKVLDPYSKIPGFKVCAVRIEKG